MCPSGVKTMFHRLFHKNSCNSPAILFFAPHQDDELLTLGIHACALNNRNANVHIFLCTDGSKSSVRRNLCNGRGCSLHKGIHSYELSIPEFVAARDAEFRTSCASLGYPPASVHIASNRCLDGELSVENAEAILRTALSGFPEISCVCTISPFGGDTQHPDHRNLGLAAIQLHEQGVIPQLILFVEPYCIQSSRDAYPELALTSSHPTKKVLRQLTNAVNAYTTWDPENRRYAIGRHSVPRSFDDFLADPIAYYHTYHKP